MIAYEVNFDGLVGPTHNYAGLAYGNIASHRNKGKTSNPRLAALQGLAKMKALADMGIRQAVLPPHDRPDLSALRQMGFTGSLKQLLASAAREAPELLAACYSASAMWTANAATVSPSADTRDRRVHFTPANLLAQFHRSLEAGTTSRVLQAIFPDEALFAHHPPLPSSWTLADEGAANHMRLTATHGQRSVEVFVFGRIGLAGAVSRAAKYPARQTLEASMAVARTHGLEKCACFVRQNPLAVDAGAFHNDVLAVANMNVLLYHADAWADPAMSQAIRRLAVSRGVDLVEIKVTAKQLSLAEAIGSYLFNSQLVSVGDGSMVLVAPEECRRTPRARRFLDWLPTSGTPIRAVRYVQVRQSMRNGGGPACLRLRVVLNKRELAAVHPGVFLTAALHEKLAKWVCRHYRDSLHPGDLADPALAEECRDALDQLTQLLQVGSIYDFQRA